MEILDELRKMWFGKFPKHGRSSSYCWRERQQRAMASIMGRRWHSQKRRVNGYESWVVGQLESAGCRVTNQEWDEIATNCPLHSLSEREMRGGEILRDAKSEPLWKFRNTIKAERSSVVMTLTDVITSPV
jgi:hypothetical protein